MCQENQLRENIVAVHLKGSMYDFIPKLLSLISLPNFAPALWGWNSNVSDLRAIYDPGIPHTRTYQQVVYSVCGNNGQQTGPNMGYACPHMMMFSTDMILAAEYDGLDEDFYYAVGGGGSDDHDCGRCYQVQPFDPESKNSTSTQDHQLIIQVVNSGFDVMDGQFDIFMAAGGFGFFNACSRDCKDKYCAGGPCVEGQYEGDFNAWNPNTPSCYGGGVRLLSNSTEEVLAACTALSSGPLRSKDEILIQSCVFSNFLLYHQNFLSSRSVAVQCPDGLSRLTGLRRSDEQGLPVAHKNNLLITHCLGSRSENRYCLSTMADCCMPSCAWNDKGSPDRVWNRIDTCKKDGTLYNYDSL